MKTIYLLDKSAEEHTMLKTTGSDEYLLSQIKLLTGQVYDADDLNDMFDYLNDNKLICIIENGNLNQMPLSDYLRMKNGH